MVSNRYRSHGQNRAHGGVSRVCEENDRTVIQTPGQCQTVRRRASAQVTTLRVDRSFENLHARLARLPGCDVQQSADRWTMRPLASQQVRVIPQAPGNLRVHLAATGGVGC